MEPSSSNRIGNFTSSVVNGSRSLANNIAAIWNGSSTLTRAFIIGVPTAVAAPLLIVPALSVAGFTSAGVAAGSLAASMQGAATVSGSVFALCQSAGATGAVAASTAMGTGVTAGLTTGGITAVVFKNRSGNPGQGDANA